MGRIVLTARVLSFFCRYQPGEGAIFDPLGLITSPEKFERLRYVEVKHGRIAMLAVLGHVAVAAGARWPGYAFGSVKFDTIEGSGFKALSQLSIQDIAISFIAIGFLEINVMKEVVKGEFPGDLRNGLFTEGWDEFSEADKKRKINIELNNGCAPPPRPPSRGYFFLRPAGLRMPAAASSATSPTSHIHTDRPRLPCSPGARR